MYVCSYILYFVYMNVCSWTCIRTSIYGGGVLRSITCFVGVCVCVCVFEEVCVLVKVEKYIVLVTDTRKQALLRHYWPAPSLAYGIHLVYWH